MYVRLRHPSDAFLDSHWCNLNISLRNGWIASHTSWEFGKLLFTFFKLNSNISTTEF